MRTAIRLAVCLVLAATARVASADWPHGTELPEPTREPEATAVTEEMGAGGLEPYALETRAMRAAEEATLARYHAERFVNEVWTAP